MQEQLPRHEEHEERHKLRALRVFVVNITEPDQAGFFTGQPPKACRPVLRLLLPGSSNLQR